MFNTQTLLRSGFPVVPRVAWPRVTPFPVSTVSVPSCVFSIPPSQNPIAFFVLH